MRQIVLATRNPHKMQEIQAIAGPRVPCRCLTEFPDAPALVEDAETFAGNASRKATQLALWLAARADRDPGVEVGAIWVLADDSGLEVDALHGAPGVRSARFASEDSTEAGNMPDWLNNAKLLRLLAGVPSERRTARFRCVLAWASASGRPIPRVRLFEGACEGRIAFEATGGKGFGYDPLFIPQGYELSFAQLGEEIKNRISHRARALARWQAALTAP